jgi:hypothetical protein
VGSRRGFNQEGGRDGSVGEEIDEKGQRQEGPRNGGSELEDKLGGGEREKERLYALLHCSQLFMLCVKPQSLTTQNGFQVAL